MEKSWTTKVVRAVRALLSTYGFGGRGRRFHRLSGIGDVAVVEIRKESSVFGDDGERFAVCFGLVPGPWWDFLRGGVEGNTLEEIGRPRPEAGIWSDRIEPPPEQPAGAPGSYGTAERWWIVRDASSAAWASERIAEELERAVLPDLIRLSEDRQAMLAELTLHDTLEITFVAEAGDADELERRLDKHLSDRAGDRAQQGMSLGLARWARGYAARKAGACSGIERYPEAVSELRSDALCRE
jgi:hypothetical protein